MPLVVRMNRHVLEPLWVAAHAQSAVRIVLILAGIGVPHSRRFHRRARYFTGPLDLRGSRPDLILSLVKFNHLQVSRYTL